jgi:hypothetical protein
MAHLGSVFQWLKREFTPYRARGKTIGVVTANQLLDERRLGGCHDHGLAYAVVVRELGYPAVMARTSSIGWIEVFHAGERGTRVGHVFVEAFLRGRWVLIDSTNGWYFEDGHDPTNPVIPWQEAIAGSTDEIYGFYVERKDIDTWVLGMHSPEESNRTMDAFARQVDLTKITCPDFTFQRFPRP